MMAEKPVLFSRGVYSLQQIVDKPEGLPCVVNTRSRLLSFQKVPIEPEGLHLCLEREVEIEFAKIKVLPFYDESEAESKHGAEFVALHSEFENEEFFLPLKFGGKLKIDSYRNKRPRFATVAEVFDQRPRYVRAVTDTMSVSPRRKGGMKMKCVSRGSILEVKGIATLKDKEKRYLRCVKSNKNFLFEESVRINFTAVADDKEYTLKQIKEADFWLPKPIQFKQARVLEEHIVQFHSDIVCDISMMLTGILDLLETARIRMLVGRAYDKQNKCFKTLLLPASLYDHLYVKRAEFETPTQRSRYIDKHFGKPSGQDDVFEDKLFLLSATEDLVYWLRCNYVADDDINDTPNSDCNYEPPPDVLEIEPSTTSFPEVAQSMVDGGKGTAVFVSVVQLLPIVGIQDQNVLHSVIQKAKLGFGLVHQELKSLSMWNENGEEIKLASRQVSIGTQEVIDNGQVTKTSRTCKRPLPDPPIDRKQPMIKKEVRVNGQQPINPGLDNNEYVQLEEDIYSSNGDDGEYVPMGNEITYTTGAAVIDSKPTHTAVSRKERVPNGDGFESYSVEETVECFKNCSLDRLAALCKEHSLDGCYMTNINQDTLKSTPFCLNLMEIDKLRMIYNGWRPRHS